MGGLWTQKGYIPSPDRKTILIHRFDGFALVDAKGQATNFHFDFNLREVAWGPDSKKFLTWTSAGELVLFDVDQIGPGPEPRFQVLRKPGQGKRMGGIEWSPDGKDAFIGEVSGTGETNKLHSEILRLTLPAAAGAPPSVAQIVSNATAIKFFMTPTPRFQYNLGPSNAPYTIFMAGIDGFYTLSPDGKTKDLILAASAENIENLEWSPAVDKEKLLLYFAKPTPLPGGEMLKGLYLVHLDRRAKGKKGMQLFELLHDKMDVHTIWFSPQGKYVTWVTWEGVYYRGVEGGDIQKIEVKDAQNCPLEIKGCQWDPAEKRIAITALNKLYVYDAEKKEKWTLSLYGKDDKTFVAEPTWRGDDIVFSGFTNIGVPRYPPKETPKKKP